uniref:Uncharacterized protein n=1 Tax=Daucus carota subsp. sativus TaxID=79200 RepID=A0A175YEJ4_DAUCS
MFPSCKGWTYTLIRERQKIEETEGTFGLGEIMAPVEDNEFIKDNAQLKSNSDDDKSATNEMDDVEGHNDCETDDNSVKELVKNDN